MQSVPVSERHVAMGFINRACAAIQNEEDPDERWHAHTEFYLFALADNNFDTRVAGVIADREIAAWSRARLIPGYAIGLQDYWLSKVRSFGPIRWHWFDLFQEINGQLPPEKQGTPEFYQFCVAMRAHVV